MFYVLQSYHHQTPEEPGNISMSCVHSIYNLKLSRIWNKFFKTAHEIKVLVQRKTGNRPVKEIKQERFFGQRVGTRMQIPFSFVFPDLVAHMCRQELVKRSVHYKTLLQAVPHSLLLGHIPPALSMLLIPGVRVGATPYHLREKRWAGPSSPAFHASKIFFKSDHHKVNWREKIDFLADYSTKISHSFPFVIHFGFEAACE